MGWRIRSSTCDRPSRSENANRNWTFASMCRWRMCALRLLARFLRVWEAWEPMEGGDEARLIVALAARHDGEDLAHHHVGDQLAGALRCIARSHQPVEGLPGLRRRSVTQ